MTCATLPRHSCLSRVWYLETVGKPAPLQAQRMPRCSASTTMSSQGATPTCHRARTRTTSLVRQGVYAWPCMPAAPQRACLVPCDVAWCTMMGMPRHAPAGPAQPCHVMSCRATPCHAMPCHVMPMHCRRAQRSDPAAGRCCMAGHLLILHIAGHVGLGCSALLPWRLSWLHVFRNVHRPHLAASADPGRDGQGGGQERRRHRSAAGSMP